MTSIFHLLHFLRQFLTGDFNRLDLSTFLAESGLFQIDISSTRGRHQLDLLITNSPNFSTCLVAKSCLRTDHHALLVTSYYYYSCHKTKRAVTFPDIKQNNLHKLAEVLHHHNYTDVIIEYGIDVAYSRFLHSLTTVQSTIPFRCVTVTI